jgi:hypothetical protein
MTKLITGTTKLAITVDSGNFSEPECTQYVYPKSQIRHPDINKLDCPVLSVAEPEPVPVERQLFAGAGVFLARLRSRVCKFF